MAILEAAICQVWNCVSHPGSSRPKMEFGMIQVLPPPFSAHDSQVGCQNGYFGGSDLSGMYFSLTFDGTLRHSRTGTLRGLNSWDSSSKLSMAATKKNLLHFIVDQQSIWCKPTVIQISDNCQHCWGCFDTPRMYGWVPSSAWYIWNLDDVLERAHLESWSSTWTAKWPLALWGLRQSELR